MREEEEEEQERKREREDALQTSPQGVTERGGRKEVQITRRRRRTRNI